MSAARYVHGYSSRETVRLADQADTLSRLLHHDTSFPAGSRVLECGCGTGAQTIHLAASCPEARITSIDISESSLGHARARVAGIGATNVEFLLADAFHLPFREARFDHVFVCFLLEHLRDPGGALRELRRVLRPAGSITVIEGDHGSWYCHPQTPEASRTVRCLIDIQARMGGDSLIGRRLYPLLVDAGFRLAAVQPRMVYVDDSTPELVEGFSRRTFIAMVEGVRDHAIALGMIDRATWEKGVADMHKATEPGGTFCYTFFKGVAIR